MNDCNIDFKLKLITEGTLKEVNDEMYDMKFEHIKDIKLFHHQLQTIHAMVDLETNKTTIEDDNYIVSEIGILANKVGTGKSMCVLSLLSHNRFLCNQDFVTSYLSENAFIMKNKQHVVTSKCNLIVVPNHLLNSVWERYIQQYTSFTYIIIKRNVFPISEWDIFDRYDIVLCSSKYYNIFIRGCPTRWNRVIFDEADTIHIPACVKPFSRFVWFVTSSLHNLLFHNGYYWKFDRYKKNMVKVITRGITNQGYIKNIFKTLEPYTVSSILKGVTIKMEDTHLTSLLKLPPIYTTKYYCKTPYYISTVIDVVPENVKSMLHGNDIESCLEQIGCPIDSTENIISFLLAKFDDQIKRCVLKQEYLFKLRKINIESEDIVSDKYERNGEKMRHLYSKINTVRAKVNEVHNNVFNEICPICMDEMNHTNVCIFVCCLNAFCAPCVKGLLLHAFDHCPFCRACISPQNIIKKSTHYNSDEDLFSKEESILKIIKELRVSNIQFRIIIFVLHEKSISIVQNTLLRYHLNFKTMRGNNIESVLKWFNSESNVILIMNASSYGSGLNIIETTHIIFYQKPLYDLYSQIVGRAYRIGRATPLHLCNLLFETENT